MVVVRAENSGAAVQEGARAAGASGGEGTGLARRRRRRRAVDRGHTVWSILSLNLDGGDLSEIGRWLSATARKGGTHGGVVLLQDVRREGKFAVPVIQEGLAPLPGLKGELSEAPRAGGRQGVAEKCMGGTYAGVWGALAERLIPVPVHDIPAAGRWAAVGVRGKTPDRRVAFVSVYRPPGSLGGVEGSLVNRYGRLYKLSEAALIHAKFYEDLSRWLAKLRADGFETIVGGDWNADLDRDLHFNKRGGATLGQWMAASGLQPLTQPEATFWAARSGGQRVSSRIDHVAGTAGTAPWWAVGQSLVPVTTCAPRNAGAFRVLLWLRRSRSSGTCWTLQRWWLGLTR